MWLFRFNSAALVAKSVHCQFKTLDHLFTSVSSADFPLENREHCWAENGYPNEQRHTQERRKTRGTVELAGHDCLLTLGNRALREQYCTYPTYANPKPESSLPGVEVLSDPNHPFKTLSERFTLKKLCSRPLVLRASKPVPTAQRENTSQS